MNCITFFKKKYSDNWNEPITWVNANVLRPGGDDQKLRDMIKNHDDKYHYLCKTEPICSFCDSSACRLKKYGVGKDNPDVGLELGITTIDTDPAIHIVNAGDRRIVIKKGGDLRDLKRFTDRCIEHRVPLPPLMSPVEWRAVYEAALEEAVHVEPLPLLSTNAGEIEVLARYFENKIVNMVRGDGARFLAGKSGADVRVDPEEKRIYFKWKPLKHHCEMACRMSEARIGEMRMFIYNHGKAHDENFSKGRWWRCTYSLPYEIFDEVTREWWFNPVVEKEFDLDEEEAA
jgi:hypothetical protein